MKCRKKILQICISLVVAIILGLIIASNVAKPISLTEKEIRNYISVAQKVWNEGVSGIEEDNIYIKLEFNSKRVTIFSIERDQKNRNKFSIDSNKESITADYTDEKAPTFIVNKPDTSFWACFLLYGLICGLIFYGIISFFSFCKSNTK